MSLLGRVTDTRAVRIWDTKRGKAVGEWMYPVERLLTDVMLSGPQNRIQWEIRVGILCLIVGDAVAEAGHSC